MHLAYLLSGINLLAAVLLAAYGFNSLVLTALFLRSRARVVPEPRVDVLPFVTVQLPVYNERWVVRRLLEAVGALDYPRDRLEIQVLDDSTDHTADIVEAVCARLRQSGLDARVVRRQGRAGYKAGALAHGLQSAKGELIAVFDADFVPEPDWLRRVVPHLAADPGLGFVQTRWGHINAVYSRVTRAQVVALDGHFVVEQTARQRNGLLMNFNGTAGIWRRGCIEGSGGWQARTLSEDLDLSYRAQLAGWRCLYLPEIVAPAELPPMVSAFKRQQRRWATGSIQCLRHLAGPLLRSRFSPWQKLQGLLHLSGYLAHPLMVLLLLVSLPLLLLDGGLRFHLTFLGLASVGPPLLYTIAQATQGRGAARRLSALPVLVLLGTGVAVSNTIAVARALRSDGGAFERTPKFSLVGATGKWRGKHYAAGADRTIIAELGMALYALAGMALAWWTGGLYALPFLGLCACSYAYVGIEGLRERRATERSTEPAVAPRLTTEPPLG